MKTSYNQIVFQIIKRCDQACPHCFFNSSPKKDEKLTLSQIQKGLTDIKFAGIKKVNKFIISGGEPTMHPDIISIIKAIRINFPSSKIRIDTNGIRFFENPKMFNLLKADVYDISVDTFHNQGILKKGAVFKNFFIEKDGTSKLVDFFVEQKMKYKFDLNIRWTSDRKDEDLFKKFIKKYGKLNIEKKLVTATGRARLLSSSKKGCGYTIKENPKNFKCLLGDSLLLAVDGFWYGCYHPVSLTKLAISGESALFKLMLENLLNSAIGNKLSKKGIANTLLFVKKENPNLESMVNGILESKYWYRCQPCEEACQKKLFR